MSCSKWSLDISAYLDGSLEPAKVSGLLQHIDQCPVCASFHQEHSRINKLFFTALPDREAPDSIWLGIEERLAVVPATEEKTSPIWDLFEWLRVPQLGYAMAAVLFCLLVGLWMVQQPEDDSRYLAELEAFTIEVKGNPFQERMGMENPFFQLSHSRSDNPFKGLGGSKQ